LSQKPVWQIKSVFNGLLVQQNDLALVKKEDCKIVSEKIPVDSDWANMLFANKIVKHTKSNTIVLAKEGILLASGTGQTSRVDALKQAIHKAKSFGFDLNGSAMASDAFFPFPDCVEIAAGEGIKSVIQPGGSIKDQDSIDACNRLGICMVTTGLRHFKH
jgi:phosphoribosylaminoimidazolecarboxamide formyltransferase/IMP cyclohydrolase